jgi:GAF domain-containing protein
VSVETVVGELEAAQARGASRDELLEVAVRAIEASESRYDWVGIYLLDGDTLTLHNYVGRPTEHSRIPVGVGVCGSAVVERRDINVPDVREVENYLACSLETRAELVVLISAPESGRIHGQIDLDSDRPAAFTSEDERELKQVAEWIGRLF